MLWLYNCAVSPGNVRFTRFVLVRVVAVPLHRVLHSRRATVSTGNIRFIRFVFVPCCGCTIAQSARVMYVLPVLYSCRAVAVPLHRVLYSRRATVSTGNVRFTRFVLGAVLWLYNCTAFCTRAVQQSARVMYVLPVLYSCRAVVVQLRSQPG